MPYKDKEQHKKYYEQYRKSQEKKDIQWRHQLRIVHSITVEEYIELLIRQDGTCAICGEPPAGKRLCVDHDHSCCPGIKHCKNCIRGLLCVRCNRSIGLFEDDSELLEKAANYLRQ